MRREFCDPVNMWMETIVEKRRMAIASCAIVDHRNRRDFGARTPNNVARSVIAQTRFCVIASTQGEGLPLSLCLRARRVPLRQPRARRDAGRCVIWVWRGYQP
jgi:hypothetical protein